MQIPVNQPHRIIHHLQTYVEYYNINQPYICLKTCCHICPTRNMEVLRSVFHNIYRVLVFFLYEAICWLLKMLYYYHKVLETVLKLMKPTLLKISLPPFLLSFPLCACVYMCAYQCVVRFTFGDFKFT